MLFLLVVISTERILHLLPPSEWRQKRHCASSALVLLDYAIARAAVQFLKRLVKLLGRYQSTMKPQEVKPKAQTDWLGFCKGGAQCPRNGRLCV